MFVNEYKTNIFHIIIEKEKNLKDVHFFILKIGTCTNIYLNQNLKISTIKNENKSNFQNSKYWTQSHSKNRYSRKHKLK